MRKFGPVHGEGTDRESALDWEETCSGSLERNNSPVVDITLNNMVLQAMHLHRRIVGCRQVLLA
jgi:hypothetical protein